MRISIVIPFHGGAADTAECIRGLGRQIDSSGRPLRVELELLLVDDASPDANDALDLRDLAREALPGAAVETCSNGVTRRGFAAAANTGLRAATGDLCLLLNNDTVPGRRFLDRLLSTWRAHPVDVLGPRCDHVKGPARYELATADASTAAGRDAIDAVLDDPSHAVRDVPTLSGVCLLFARSLLGDVGLFDERFAPGNYEDDDFCLRIRRNGGRLAIAQSAFLHHRGHATFARDDASLDTVLRAMRARFDAKWGDDTIGRAYIAWLDGDADGAARLAEAAVDAHPRWPDGYALVGRAALADGRVDAAIRALEAYVTACPADPTAWLDLAIARIERGTATDLERSTTALAAALRHPAGVDPHRAAAALVQRLDAADDPVAADPLAFARAFFPDEPEVWNALGVGLLEASRGDEAERVLEAAERLGSRHATTNRGVCQWRQGRHDDALATLEAAVLARPDDPIARANLASARAARPVT